MLDRFKNASDEISFLVRNHRIEDSEGNFAVAVNTRHSRYLVLNEPADEGAPYIIPERFCKRTDEKGMITAGVRGYLYNKDKIPNGGWGDTSAILSIELSNGETLSITHTDSKTFPPVPYGKKNHITPGP